MPPRTKTALILSDWQCDLQDQDYVNRTLALARDLQPDKIVHVGDESDATAIGRWVRDTPEEIESNLQEQIDVTHANLARFREACPGSDFSILYSNHLERFAHATRTRVPGYRTLRSLSIENLFRLGDLGIRYERSIAEIFPGVLGVHGHQLGLTSSNQYLRGTAWAHKLGASLVAGHTHRPLLCAVSVGYVNSGGTVPGSPNAGATSKMTSHFYMNVGCSMDFAKAEYITSRSPEWGHGVGILEHNTRTGWTQPHLLIADGNRFKWGGRWY